MATEWQVDKLRVTEAARAIQDASGAEVTFVRLPDDANIVIFSIMIDKSTFCGNVHIQDSAIGRMQRLKITVSDDSNPAPPKPGGIGGIFAKRPSYSARPDVVAKAIEKLQAALPPIF